MTFKTMKLDEIVGGQYCQRGEQADEETNSGVFNVRR